MPSTHIEPRERLSRDTVDQLARDGTIFIDHRRSRPLYFDGRFLAARDLTREQNYFLTRQADLSHTFGNGIVRGLMVERETATSIRILPGHGITPAGEPVIVASPLAVRLTDVAKMQQLDATFGLLKTPRDPARNATGLFIVALRPVEFSANPIASYPTTLTGPRNVEDGDIIEGLVVTLIPYQDQGDQTDAARRRARLALDIFVHRGSRGVPAPVLPLAMIALERGIIQWIDPYLVRRELSMYSREVFSLGTMRAIREAHVMQYEEHLREVLQARRQANLSLRFAAAEQFFALPPVGHLPAAAIEPRDFTQIYFPSDVDVFLSFVPEDEVPALVEESLLLPPIDLTGPEGELDSTSVLVLAPVPRHLVRRVASTLTAVTRELKPAAPGLVARRRPLEALRGLSLRFPTLPVVRPEDLADAEWRKALAGAELLWYVRQRNLRYQSDAVSRPLLQAGDVELTKKVRELMADYQLLTPFNEIEKRTTADANVEFVRMLALPGFDRGGKTVAAGALNELKAKTAEPLDVVSVVAVSTRYNDPRLGEGIQRLETKEPRLRSETAVRENLQTTLLVPELDRIGRLLRTDGDLEAFTTDLLTAAHQSDAAARGLILKKLQELEG